ncbi:MAG: hypothetical protein V7676_14370 [Parasphingorhabdus sp.]|uniref:hypothetical protein n=1 Tax=Parasphingorhabdus sp. TaxID=2709688 RepID=UPI003003404B
MKFFWRTITAAAVSVAVRTVMKKIQNRSENKSPEGDELLNPVLANPQSRG